MGLTPAMSAKPIACGIPTTAPVMPATKSFETVFLLWRVEDKITRFLCLIAKSMSVLVYLHEQG